MTVTSNLFESEARVKVECDVFFFQLFKKSSAQTLRKCFVHHFEVDL